MPKSGSLPVGLGELATMPYLVFIRAFLSVVFKKSLHKSKGNIPRQLQLSRVYKQICSLYPAFCSLFSNISRIATLTADLKQLILLLLVFIFTLVHAKSEREFSDWSSWSKCTECPDSKQIRRRNCLQRKCNGPLEGKQPCPYKKCGRLKCQIFQFLWGIDQHLTFNDFKRWRNVKIYVQFVKQKI